jgi:hypothetical protein
MNKMLRALRTRYHIKSIKETVCYENKTDAKLNQSRSIASEKNRRTLERASLCHQEIC